MVGSDSKSTETSGGNDESLIDASQEWVATIRALGADYAELASYEVKTAMRAAEVLVFVNLISAVFMCGAWLCGVGFALGLVLGLSSPAIAVLGVLFLASITGLLMAVWAGRLVRKEIDLKASIERLRGANSTPERSDNTRKDSSLTSASTPGD